VLLPLASRAGPPPMLALATCVVALGAIDDSRFGFALSISSLGSLGSEETIADGGWAPRFTSPRLARLVLGSSDASPRLARSPEREYSWPSLLLVDANEEVPVERPSGRDDVHENVPCHSAFPLAHLLLVALVVSFVFGCFAWAEAHRIVRVRRGGRPGAPARNKIVMKTARMLLPRLPKKHTKQVAPGNAKISVAI